MTFCRPPFTESHRPRAERSALRNDINVDNNNNNRNIKYYSKKNAQEPVEQATSGCVQREQRDSHTTQLYLELYTL